MLALPRVIVGLSIVLAALSLHARCHAEGGVIDMGGMSDERARSHFKVGKTLYEAGRFSEAAKEWEQAYELSHKGAILYNLYVAYRDAGDLPQATDALRRYLATDEVDPDARVNLEARLRALEQTNSRAASQPNAEQPAPEPAAAPPVPSETVASAPAPSPAPQSPASQPSAEHAATSIWPFVLFAAGGAMIVGSVATGIVANNKISDIEDHCPGSVCPRTYPLESQRSDAKTFRTVTLVLGAAGIITAGAGAVLLLLPTAAKADARAGRIVVPGFACAGNGCAGSVSGRF